MIEMTHRKSSQGLNKSSPPSGQVDSLPSNNLLSSHAQWAKLSRDGKEMCKKRDARAKLYFSLLKLPISWARDLA